MGRLHAVVKRHGGGGRRRLAPIQKVLADRIPGYDPGADDWEQRMDCLWDRLGLPPAQRQFRIRAGGHTYRVDRAIVAEKIAVEWDGYDPHGHRSNFDSDSDRRRPSWQPRGGWCSASPPTPDPSESWDGPGGRRRATPEQDRERLGPHQGCQQCLQLQLGLGQLLDRVGAGDDAVAGVDAGPGAGDLRGADADGPDSVAPPSTQPTGPA